MKYDLIIIGAGPAGVSAAVYAKRQQLNMMVISKDLGGQVAKKAVDIENYPGFEKISGPDLVDLYQKQLEANQLAVTTEEVLEIKKEGEIFFVHCASGTVYESVAIIVASGAQSRLLNVPGEDEFAGKGVSYCSLCDGPIFKGKDVVVVGGGNNGFETAVFLSNYVKSVTVLEYSDSVKADAENRELVEKQGEMVKVITNAQVMGIGGEMMVNSITYKDRASGQEKKLATGGIFVEIGYAPSTGFLGDLVEYNDNKEVVADLKTLQTKTPGLFSAGDCNVSKYKQIVMASGQGALAALSAYEYIKKHK